MICSFDSVAFDSKSVVHKHFHNSGPHHHDLGICFRDSLEHECLPGDPHTHEDQCFYADGTELECPDE